MERSDLIKFLQTPAPNIPIAKKATAVDNYLVELGKDPEKSREFIQTVITHDADITNRLRKIQLLDQLFLHVLGTESQKQEIHFLINLRDNSIITIF